MMLLGSLAPCVLLLCACIVQHFSMSAAARDRGHPKGQRGGAEPAGQRAGVSAVAANKGKFSTKNDKMQCTWAAREDPDMPTSGVRLRVHCQYPEARITGGVTERSCEYSAKPSSCEAYTSNPAGFWKQVARALKKLQSKLCTDTRALVKAGVCRRASRDAHFKLDIRTAVASAQQPDDDESQSVTPYRPTTIATTTTTTKRLQTQGTPPPEKSCTERVDQQKLAEEYCSSSWASLCTFFFSMVQSGSEC